MASNQSETKGLRIAIEGCGHGTLNAIYASVQKSCKMNGWDGVDLLIIGGDFQAVRNSSDLNCMSVPPKYREIGDFHEYYSGVRQAPYLTIFIGGNHEASNHLFELHYGGWVAPNMYYLGAANVVRLGPLRIAGLSGIWKGYNYNKSHYERLPYNQDDIRSIYHIREIDVRKLLQIRTQVDVGISHDWPRAVEWSGDHKALFKRKDLFEADSKAGTLGSPAAKYVLERLKPAFWFSAHMHIKFAATVKHQKVDPVVPDSAVNDAGLTIENGSTQDDGGQNASVQKRNEEEIDLDMDESDEDRKPTEQDQSLGDESKSTEQSTVPQSLREQLPASFKKQAQTDDAHENTPPTDITNKTTKFLALDKCLPGRKFLQILSIEPISEQPKTRPEQKEQTRPRLEYDKEWLAITRVFAPEINFGDRSCPLPPNRGESFYRPLIEKEEQWVEENIVSKNGLLIPENFERTAPIYDPKSGKGGSEMPVEYNNPQTAAFCELVGIENKLFLTDDEKNERMRNGPQPEEVGNRNQGGQARGRGSGRGRGRGHGGRGRQWR
ncbi:MAG: hypothetical protein M1816_004638 [Peltula sp. TS41687]|nr:MAG: hypothetical protein M1816_004638 [Peltula sp. TS41687]